MMMFAKSVNNKVVLIGLHVMLAIAGITWNVWASISHPMKMTNISVPIAKPPLPLLIYQEHRATSLERIYWETDL